MSASTSACSVAAASSARADSSALAPVSVSRGLDWRDRPEGLQGIVTSSFEALSRQSSSGWGFFNGDDSYGICGIYEDRLLKAKIQQNPKQKKWVVLDVGAGDFRLSRSIAKYIDGETDLPEGTRVEIYGVRGEAYNGERTIETTRCTVHNIGSFKIEELSKAFKALSIDIEGKVDLILSRWCFRHLADPAGTFAQAYDHLRAGGHLLIDGFFLLHHGDNLYYYNANVRITQLFIDTRAPFLTIEFSGGRSLNHFILQKTNSSRCNLPMSYASHEHADRTMYQIGSSCVTGFRREAQPHERAFCIPTNRVECSHFMYGDKEMHDWLKINGLIDNPRSVHRPIFTDVPFEAIPLPHQAALRGDLASVKRYLNEGHNIDESDFLGRTMLHIAIETRNWDLFSYLMVNGAHFGLSDSKRHTPLHQAAIFDTDGRFLDALIESGALIDGLRHDVEGGSSPLSCAIKAKNPLAVERLIKAKAKLSKKNFEDLEDEAFSSLHERGIIPPMTSGVALANIVDWIKRGDCVVLHTAGVNGMMYEFPNSRNKQPRLIVADINPTSHLLDEGEWPDFIEGAGYKFIPYNANVLQRYPRERILQYRFAY